MSRSSRTGRVVVVKLREWVAYVNRVSLKGIIGYIPPVREDQLRSQDENEIVGSRDKLRIGGKTPVPARSRPSAIPGTDSLANLYILPLCSYGFM